MAAWRITIYNITHNNIQTTYKCIQSNIYVHKTNNELAYVVIAIIQ